MNRQEIFDKVWAHAGTMKAKANESGDRDDTDGLCRYIAPNGERCWIGGILSPAGCADAEAMGGTVRYLGTAILDTLGVSGDSDKDFLAELQMIHDKQRMDDWEAALRAFAALRGLTAPSTPLFPVQVQDNATVGISEAVAG